MLPRFAGLNSRWFQEIRHSTTGVALQAWSGARNSAIVSIFSATLPVPGRRIPLAYDRPTWCPLPGDAGLSEGLGRTLWSPPCPMLALSAISARSCLSRDGPFRPSRARFRRCDLILRYGAVRTFSRTRCRSHMAAEPEFPSRFEGIEQRFWRLPHKEYCEVKWWQHDLQRFIEWYTGEREELYGVPARTCPEFCV
jgi:hypothetical protein